MTIAATYYDGRTARRHNALLSVERGMLRIQTSDLVREEAIAKVKIPTALGTAPRKVILADGAHCEVVDHAAFAQLFPQISWVAHLENRWRYALVALLLIAGIIAATYVWGLPYIANLIAQRIPENLVASIDQQFLDAVDGKLLLPSQLPHDRQTAITHRVQSLHLPAGAKLSSRILYRRSPQIGANAFALPGGTVVILDEIVKLSDNDDEIIGVLAHEMGHVSEYHALRQMLQASVVGLVATWYVGDISSLLALAPATLLETHYSRDFERRADIFAAQTLALNHISATRLADMLEKLERAHGETQKNSQHTVMDYLSSHPATDERIKMLRGQR